MTQNLLGLIGALDGLWPLGRKQNYVNMCKREQSGGYGMAQKLLGLLEALEGLWPMGRGQN